MTKLRYATSIDGLRIAYEVAGNRSPALVFVHGRACNRTNWRRQIPEFARSRKVVAVDLGGHGRSGVERYRWTIASFASDVVAAIEAESLEPVILVGHSMGGCVIVEVARLTPERVSGIVGVESEAFRHLRNIPSEEERRAEMQKFQNDYVREAVAGAFTPSADPALIAEITDQVLGTSPEVVVDVIAEALSTSSAFETTRSLHVPKFAILSNLWPMDHEAARDAGVEVIPMEGVGHFPMLEAPDEFNEHLHDIVAAISAK